MLLRILTIKLDRARMFRSLMDMKVTLQDPKPVEGDSEALKTVKNALRTILDTIRHSFLRG